MNQATSKFIPPLKSALDLQTLELMRQKVNSLLNGRVTTTSGRNVVTYADGNVVWEVNAESVDNGFPFSIYNINNVSATDGQEALFSSQGLDIDYFTFQIRNGMVGCRPFLNNPQTGSLGNITSLAGNWELLISAQCTDQVDGLEVGGDLIDFYYPETANTGTTIILDDTNPTLITGVAAGSGMSVLGNQIVLNQNPTQGTLIVNPNLRCAAFWIEVIDDPVAGIQANLWGRMFSAEVDSTRTNNPIPTGPNIIPIGYVRVQNPAGGDGQPVGYFLEQIQSGNAVNRFPPGFSCMRGRWQELYATLPAGFTNLNWYPNDIVLDDTTLDDFGFYGLYQYTENSVGLIPVTENPAIGSAFGWVQVGCSDS